jgi:hypothetical protein
VGSYVWRTFENTKARPNFLVASAETFHAAGVQPQLAAAERSVAPSAHS